MKNLEQLQKEHNEMGVTIQKLLDEQRADKWTQEDINSGLVVNYINTSMLRTLVKDGSEWLFIDGGFVAVHSCSGVELLETLNRYYPKGG